MNPTIIGSFGVPMNFLKEGQFENVYTEGINMYGPEKLNEAKRLTGERKILDY
jgi:hypothetical protein